MNTYDPSQHPRATDGTWAAKHRDEPDSDGLAVANPVLSTPFTDPDDTTCWRMSDGKLHRTDGPAITWPDGSEQWYSEGKMHRVDGPAATWDDGSEAWYLDGKLHRLDGPAVIQPDGSFEWHEDGERKDPEVEAVLTMLWHARTP